jgi:hypothetical protein
MATKSKKKLVRQLNTPKTGPGQHQTSVLKKSVQYLQFVPKRVGAVLTGLSLVSSLLAYSVLWPSLSLSNIQTNHQSILSTKFLLSNDGWFPVYNLRISCNFIVTEYKPDYNGPKLQQSATASNYDHVHTLKSNEKLSDSCEFSTLINMPKINGVSGLSLTPKEILAYATKAHLSVSMTFKPFFQWPINVQFPFKMDLDRDLFYWIPEPLEHYETAFKNRSG